MSLRLLASSFAIGALFASSSARAEDVPRRVVLEASASWAPSYSNPTARDAHDLGTSEGAALGGRLEARYRLASWVSAGLGIDYLQSLGPSPARHLTPLLTIGGGPWRVGGADVGFAVAYGHGVARYEDSGYATDGSLRGPEDLFEVKLALGIPVTDAWAVTVAGSGRIFVPTFTNATSYARYGLGGPGSATVLSLGARFAF